MDEFKITRPPNEGNICFMVPGVDEPVVKLQHNGDIYVRGKLIENDKQLVDGVREWLAIARVQ